MKVVLFLLQHMRGICEQQGRLCYAATAMRSLSQKHRMGTYCPASNGGAARAVKRLEEGTLGTSGDAGVLVVKGSNPF